MVWLVFFSSSQMSKNLGGLAGKKFLNELSCQLCPAAKRFLALKQIFHFNHSMHYEFLQICPGNHKLC